MHPLPMSVRLSLAPFLALLLLNQAHAEDARPKAVFPGERWQTRDPRAVGFDPKKLDAFARAVGGDGVVIKDGYLVKSWGRADRPGDWASAGKPVLSTLLFFAVAEKKLAGVDDPVRPFVRRWPGKDLIAKDRPMTFRHLADMTSGYARAEAPGACWAYNDYGIKLYGLLLDEVFGSSLDEAARKRLAPLQLQDGGVFGSRRGLGVNASPRDFARIGWFWLHQGRWNDKQVLPREFFTRYCKADVPADLPRTRKAGSDYLKIGTHGGGSDQSDQGPGIYGFNWWFAEPRRVGKGTFMDHLPVDSFQANGHWGRECMLIVPSLRLVAACRGQWGGTDLPRAALLIEALEGKGK